MQEFDEEIEEIEEIEEGDVSELSDDIEILSDDEENEITGGASISYKTVRRKVSTNKRSIKVASSGKGLYDAKVSPSGKVSASVSSASVTFSKYSASFRGTITATIIKGGSSKKSRYKNIYTITFK